MADDETGKYADLKGQLVDIGDTRLFVEERGAGRPLIILHGGPGLDHRMFGDYLDALADNHQLIFVDQRSQGRSEQAPEDTWSLKHMAEDVVKLADAVQLVEYVVLGHSYGALVALQNAVDFPGQAAMSIISSGFPSARFLDHVDMSLKSFEPAELREQVTASWEKETEVETAEQVAELLKDQLPFHFANPMDSLITEYGERASGTIYSPDVLRFFAKQEYGGIEVEDRLGEVTQPTLVLAGRHDRACSVAASEAIAAGIPNSDMVVFENSAHMTFVEENHAYLAAVRKFLGSQD